MHPSNVRELKIGWTELELGVAAQVSFIHGDAAGHVADEKVDVAACIGASWIAGGVAGTIALMAR